MCTYVRLQADADINDAPLGTLTVYARMAYNDILSRRRGWPHLEVAYTLTTVGAQASYALSALNVTGMDSVTAIVDNQIVGSRLFYTTRSDADWYYGNPTAPSATNATAWTMSGDQTIVLFPTPATSGKTYTVRGFRSETSWPTTAGSVADLPRVFDEPICQFMLAQYYMSQEDIGNYQTYLQHYEMQVSRFVKSETTKSNAPRPLVVGGNNRSYGPTFLQRQKGGLE